ncbi:MAG: 2-oxoglutarate oxidoreductase [Candidatus Omnitrophica bacterium]|nr:2-oxoglutarate oxidoreductase [Candidatus Omnitrophota bacterium]MBU4346663.1 2-oxoglutarate oxidoreductase [Candidatus Omnitrophota bacterium]MBU4473001.1 2-oxoglutarate oxidoreductase [Candidatus Omnitrophota bacterium]MCG2706817.1 thiamine pyrophosphate-dependent enzyme [Candidatus Omnitrophota bacterium]
MVLRKIYGHPKSLRNVSTHYCAGCGHGIAHRLIAEVVDELDIRERTVAIAPVGCAVLAYDYWDFDCSEAAHGRALAVATGIKQVRPQNIVFTYQGDGDLAAIGTNETIHTANRGENLTVVFINNAVYGMTGGQMAPTTLLGQRTATTPKGREARLQGYPLKISELLAQLPAVKYIERVSLHSPQEVVKAKRAIKEAFKNQINNEGFSLVEILSPCPTYWQMSPSKALDWIREAMIKEFPLGRIK